MGAEDRRHDTLNYFPAPGMGKQTPMLQAFGAMQSAAVWHGKAHLPYWVLQW
jgi:hypothetical protein